MAVLNELDRYFAQEDGSNQAQATTPQVDELGSYFQERQQDQPQPTQESDLDKYFKEQEADRPSRAGAIGRAVAEEFVPATAAGLAVGAISKLPLPAVPKFLVGATGAILAANVAGRTQEAVARGVVGPEAVKRFKEQRERDIAQYPVSTFAASALTPTVGALAGLGRKGIGAAGGAIRKAFTKAEQAAPEVAGT